MAPNRSLRDWGGRIPKRAPTFSQSLPASPPPPSDRPAPPAPRPPGTGSTPPAPSATDRRSPPRSPRRRVAAHRRPGPRRSRGGRQSRRSECCCSYRQPFAETGTEGLVGLAPATSSGVFVEIGEHADDVQATQSRPRPAIREHLQHFRSDQKLRE